MTDHDGPAVQDPRELERRFDRLDARRQHLEHRLNRAREELASVESFLARAPEVEARLEQLTRALFGEILDEVQTHLTYMLHEVLGQDRRVRSQREVSRGKLAVRFEIEHDDEIEDVLVGQGGSVSNVLSIGLRLLTLAQLPEAEHRRFLVLDEQDCWLKPQLVGRLMHIIHVTAERLGFQVLVISHHDQAHFRDSADRIYRVHPDEGEGARIELTFDRSTMDATE